MTTSTQAFTEAIDCVRARITARGCLSVPSIDLIRGTAEVLARLGHPLVTVDLRDVVVADPDALDLLTALGEDLRRRSVELVVLPDRKEHRP